MRTLSLIFSLGCALVAAAIGVDVIDLGEHGPHEARMSVAWAAGAFALYVLAALVDGWRWDR